MQNSTDVDTELVANTNQTQQNVKGADTPVTSAAQAVSPQTLFSHPVAHQGEDMQEGTEAPSHQLPSSDLEADIEEAKEKESPSKGKDEATSSWLSEHKPMIYRLSKWAFLIFWFCYSLAAFIIDFERARVLFIIDLLIVLCIVYDQGTQRWPAIAPGNMIERFGTKPWVVTTFHALCIIFALVVIVLCTYKDPGRLVALCGLVIFVGCCYAFSWNRPKIIWRPVFWGFGLQFTFALFILRTEVGFEMFQWLGDAAKTLLDFTLIGSDFVYGYLATGEPGVSVFAFSILPTVIFFSSLVSILYYLGVLQFIIYYLSIVMQYSLGTSSSESLNAAGNIFVGMTEAPLLIRPFLPTMTRSELHAVMTGGFATIAGGVLAVYIFFGVSAAHLLTASVMSAPASLAISKIVYPEDEISPTARKKRQQDEHENTAEKVLRQIGRGNETNVIEAAANGASVAVGLVANIIGMLIAFLALIGMLDYLFAYWGSLIDVEVTFTSFMGYICFPIAIIMGIEPADAQWAGELIAQKIVANEFVAYLNFTAGLEEQNISERSQVILIYALCGFSNLGSMGIVLGGLTPLAPLRSKDLSELVLSAMICGNIACFMTACIAALLYDPDR